MVLEEHQSHTLLDFARGALRVLAEEEESGGLKTERRCRSNGCSKYETIIRIWSSFRTSN